MMGFDRGVVDMGGRVKEEARQLKAEKKGEISFG